MLGARSLVQDPDTGQGPVRKMNQIDGYDLVRKKDRGIEERKEGRKDGRKEG